MTKWREASTDYDVSSDFTVILAKTWEEAGQLVREDIEMLMPDRGTLILTILGLPEALRAGNLTKHLTDMRPEAHEGNYHELNDRVSVQYTKNLRYGWYTEHYVRILAHGALWEETIDNDGYPSLDMHGLEAAWNVHILDPKVDWQVHETAMALIYQAERLGKDLADEEAYRIAADAHTTA